MPIYEFRCLKCNDCFELLMMNSDDSGQMQCPHCSSEEFERVMSTSCHTVAGGGAGSRASVKNRTCSSGSCTTYEIPGHSR